jgi:predicted negative regulator of RcsB-dependent stress response
MSARNLMFLVLGVAIAAGAVLGYRAWQDPQASGVEIDIDSGGVTIDRK